MGRQPTARPQRPELVRALRYLEVAIRAIAARLYLPAADRFDLLTLANEIGAILAREDNGGHDDLLG